MRDGTQKTLLEHLQRTGGSHTVVELAQALGVTKAAVKGALLRLLKHGLVMRSHQTVHNVWSATPPTLAGDPPPHTPPLFGDLPRA